MAPGPRSVPCSSGPGVTKPVAEPTSTRSASSRSRHPMINQTSRKHSGAALMLLSMTEEIAYCVRPLDASTWDAFAEVVERNNGVFGGCWCMGFHPERFQMYRAGYAGNRAAKEAKVREGRAHAALVFDDDGIAQGW